MNAASALASTWALSPESSAGRNLAAGERRESVNVKEMKLSGQHNYTNALAAWRWQMPQGYRVPAA